MRYKKYNKDTINIKIIKIIGVICLFIFIIKYPFRDISNFTNETKKFDQNPLIGQWEAKIKSQNSMKLVFDEDKLTINDRPQKLTYEIKSDIVIAKNTIYGFSTDITPPIKFRIIDEKTIEEQFGEIKIIYKKIK